MVAGQDQHVLGPGVALGAAHIIVFLVGIRIRLRIVAHLLCEVSRPVRHLGCF